MSRNLYVSALDLEKFRSVQGSRDEALLDSALDRNRELIVEHDRYFRTFPGITRYTPLAEALAQIVRGEVDRTLSPLFQFEHAAALLADFLGERLDADQFVESAPALWDEVDAVIRRRLLAASQADFAWPTLAGVLKRGSCLNIPIDPAWPLGSGYLTADEVRTATPTAVACDLETLDDTLDDLQWPEEALDAATQYRSWLLQAAAKGVGLYFHA
jgi:hypothetical protein